jgi:hypothetical protein
VHIDNLAIAVVGGIAWSEETVVTGPTTPTADGIAQSVTIPDLCVHVDAVTSATPRSLKVEIDVRDLSKPMVDRPILLHWTPPIAAEGWTWWKDIAAPQPVSSELVAPLTFSLASHEASLYPLLLGDGVATAAGMATDTPLAINTGETVDIGWWARVADRRL